MSMLFVDKKSLIFNEIYLERLESHERKVQKQINLQTRITFVQ